jgi:hypothetical protein
MKDTDAIKHFQSLQKRYTTQHNGEACMHVQLALNSFEHSRIRKTSEEPPEFCDGNKRGTVLAGYYDDAGSPNWIFAFYPNVRDNANAFPYWTHMPDWVLPIKSEVRRNASENPM